MKATFHVFNTAFVKAVVVVLFFLAGTFSAHAYLLTVTKVGPGAVSGGSSAWSTEIACGVTCSFNYPDSPTKWISLTATVPTPGGIFVGWSGACVGTDPYVCTIPLTTAKNVTATFDTITASAGADSELTLPTNSVVISGASASDLDGSVTSVLWTQTSGPSTATIVNGNTLTPTFSNFVVGAYIIRLTATDNLGRTYSNEKCLVVKAANPSSASGALWGWGGNNAGVLGLGYTSTCAVKTPAQSGVGTNWKSVTGGFENSAGIKTDGTLWTWGVNNYGQIGINYPTNYYSPIEPLPGTTWQSVSAMGQFTTTAIKSDGTLWTWGRNCFWALGRSVAAYTDCSPGTVAYRTPTQVGTATNWSQISNGDTYSMAVRTDGTLWAWGRYVFDGEFNPGVTANQYAPIQIGVATNWSSIAVSNYLMAAGIKTDGTLWTWGQNYYGNLGLGDVVNRNIPTQVLAGTTWKSVTLGLSSAGAIKSDGTLWTWGGNSSGELGLGDTINRSAPTQVLPGTTWSSVSAGNNHVMAVKSDGTMWGWGSNYSGALGLGDSINRNSPTQVGTGTNWGSVTTGDNFTLAITGCLGTTLRPSTPADPNGGKIVPGQVYMVSASLGLGSICFKNDSSNTYFVPVKTAAEFNTFWGDRERLGITPRP